MAETNFAPNLGEVFEVTSSQVNLFRGINSPGYVIGDIAITPAGATYEWDGDSWNSISFGGGGGAAQTPWAQDIQGAGFDLLNVRDITATRHILVEGSLRVRDTSLIADEAREWYFLSEDAGLSLYSLAGGVNFKWFSISDPNEGMVLHGSYSFHAAGFGGKQLSLLPNANETPLTIGGYSLTGSNATSMLDLAGTWNTSGTPTALKLNLTDTASNAASLLMDLQVGGVSKFSVFKAGRISFGDAGLSMYAGVSAGQNGGASFARNYAFGYEALSGVLVTPHANTNPGGERNIAIGYRTLKANTTGYGNIAIGNEALILNTTGIYNQGVGNFALHNNTTGQFNHAFGDASLEDNTTGNNNCGYGYRSLGDNTTGAGNTAFGTEALSNIITADDATAFGNKALRSNLNPMQCAFGSESLFSCVSDANTNNAFGYATLKNNLEGDSNNAFGTFSLNTNIVGNRNSAFGHWSLLSCIADDNTVFGYLAGYQISSGSQNLFLGSKAGEDETTGSGNIIIGYDRDTPAPGTSNHLNLGGVIKAPVGTQLLGAQRTGWSAATGGATRTTFDTTTVTLPQLAERMKALVDDFLVHGAIGA